MMQYIDLETWKRKEHFQFFHRMDYPQYNICANVDVTHFRNFVKSQAISFYYAMIYAATWSANQIENFRYRIREDRIILHEQLHASFTALNEEEDDLFKFITVDLDGTLLEFVQAAAEKARNKKVYFDQEDEERDDLVYLTCVPWISFTHVSHTISLNRNDAAPRLSWGKYFVQGDRLLLPFSVQVNHAFVDGIHVGRYFTVLQQYLDDPGK